MANDQTTPATPVVEKKHRSPLVWIALTCVGCMLILCCIVSVIGVLCVSNADFQDKFKTEYCKDLKDQGIKPSDDPFGICK